MPEDPATHPGTCADLEALLAPLPHLLDVLDMLPHDVVYDNIWKHLGLDGGRQSRWLPPFKLRASIRLVCRQSLVLANTLSTQQLLNLQYCYCTSDSRDVVLEELHPIQQEARLQLDQLAAHLQQQPRPVSLVLFGWTDHDSLLTAVRRFGGATGGRLMHLTLACDVVSPALFGAIRQGCPGLRELVLEPPCDEDADASWPSQASVFQPVYGSHLTKLVMNPMRNTSSYGIVPNASHNVLHSLGGLTGLQHLELSLHRVDAQAMSPALAGLANLRHCELWSIEGSITLAEAAPLLTSTHLTALRLIDVATTSDATPDALAPALSRLGALADLQALQLGYQCVVDDAAFAAVRCLTRLTQLVLGRIHLTAPAAGHLPALRSLRMMSSRPAQVLHTLLPLLPLPALTRLEFEVDISLDDGDTVPTDGSADADSDGGDGSDAGDGSDVADGSDGGGDGEGSEEDGANGEADAGMASQSVTAWDEEAAAQCAALWSVAQHLAAAPRLRLPRLHLAGRAQQQCLTLEEVASRLGPLAGRVTGVTLKAVVLTLQSWIALGRWDPHLERLHLTFCEVDGLATLVRVLVQLQELSLDGCSNISSAAWLQLAAACSRPLHIEVRPRIPPALVNECRAVQAAAYGEQHITWTSSYGPL